MYYRITITKNKEHFLSTSENSITTMFKLKHIIKVLKEKFPKEEGYEITATKWEKYGYEMHIPTILEEK